MNIFKINQLFDSHCHINVSAFDKDRSLVIRSAQKSGIEKIIDVGVDFQSTVKALEISEIFKDIIYPTCGIQPEVIVPGSDIYVKEADLAYIEREIKKLDDLIKNNRDKFVMIGECGIDYYWLKKNKTEDEVFEKSKKLQIQLFKMQVELAKKYNLPLTIHERWAFEDIINIIKENSDVTGIFHSFTGNYIQAKKILDIGFKIGINGIITYKSASTLRETIKKIIGNKKINFPVDLYNKGIYLETDSPFLGVGILRGKRNEPKVIAEIFNFIKNIV